MTTTDFNKEVYCGNDFVAVKIIENCDDLKIGNIYIPQSSEQNTRLAFCQVISIGENALEKTGCKVGDYVMIDRLATYGHTSPVACLKYDSVICLANDSKTDFSPLKDMLFVEPDEKEDVTQVDGIYMLNYAEKLNLGTVTKTGFELDDAYPFKAGDKVMMTKGADIVTFGEVKIYIYKKDMIICKVEEK